MPLGNAADTGGGAQAAAALAALRGLRRLSMQLGVGQSEPGREFAAGLLASLPALTRLTALSLSSGDDRRAPPPLCGCADSLLELTLGDYHTDWDATALGGVPPMPGVTRLQLLE